MPAWLLPLLTGLGKLLTILAKLVGPLMAYLAGKRRAEADTISEAKEKRDEQVEIAARKPLDRDELLDRMRRNGL